MPPAARRRRTGQADQRGVRGAGGPGGPPYETLSRERLIALARGRDHEAFDRSIDVMVSRLRRCLEDDPRRPRWLQTVWGKGYVFVPDGAARDGEGA
ncbi:winged helix-turn-helix domain-containing protein [Rhodanobacter geophilus]|uniref:Winged helix-turn-helix domain-containing protein n=1 Tax=Rhodanobacter geophilus TaxID=3162488 RepID=A0ABV3QNE9_9GAMM